jgi:hypothetical protein
MHHVIASRSSRRSQRHGRRPVVAAAVLVVIAALGGCSSPREKLIESADKECSTIIDRFDDDLAFVPGEKVSADKKKLRGRVALIEDLQKHVRAMPALESPADRARLKAWLETLDAYVYELNSMRNALEVYKPGMGVLIVRINHDLGMKAKEAGAAAKKFGFDSCARTEQWEYIGAD